MHQGRMRSYLMPSDDPLIPRPQSITCNNEGVFYAPGTRCSNKGVDQNQATPEVAWSVFARVEGATCLAPLCVNVGTRFSLPRLCMNVDIRFSSTHAIERSTSHPLIAVLCRCSGISVYSENCSMPPAPSATMLAMSLAIELVVFHDPTASLYGIYC